MSMTLQIDDGIVDRYILIKKFHIPDLLEMPQTIALSSVDPSLNYSDDNTNLIKAKNLLSTYKEKIRDIQDNITLYVTSKKHEYFVLDHNDIHHPVLLYYVKYKTKHLPGTFKKYVCQIWVWRSGSRYANKIATEIFWDHLIHIENVIGMDCKQTEYGKRFWSYRIEEAENKGYNLYYIDHKRPNDNHKLISLKDIDAIQKKLYGENDEYQNRLLLISKFPIDVVI